MAVSAVEAIKRGRIVMNMNPIEQDSQHTYILELPCYSHKDIVTRFLKDRAGGWPTVSFSFANGHLAGLENLFTLHLDYGAHPNAPAVPGHYLSVSLAYRLKRVPWKHNEELDLIVASSVRISSVYEVSCTTGVAIDFLHSPTVMAGFRGGITQTATYLPWSRDFTGIKITVNVTRRQEGSVQIVTSNLFPTMTMAIANAHHAHTNKMFSKYFLSETLSDCKVVVGDHIFPAHRFVLTEISGFFVLMFQIEMIEKQKKEWKVNDFGPTVVQEFLEFAYTGTSKNIQLAKNTEFLKDLFRMAHKYEAVFLKIQCESLLNSLINVENVVSLYQFGCAYDSKSLKDFAKIYFNRYKPQVIPDSDALRELHDLFPADMIYELLIE